MTQRDPVAQGAATLGLGSMMNARDRSTPPPAPRDRFSPATAGFVTGAVAGPLMVLTSDQTLLYLRGVAGTYFATIGTAIASLGHAFTDGALDFDPRAMAYLVTALLGALLGAAFAILTQRLRRFVPLLFWALVFFPTTWLLVHAYGLALIDPTLRTRLPFLPILAGTVVYAFVVSLELPLRRND